MVDAGLIVEGGGMRGIYAAGVLDYFIDHDIYFKSTYGVSAGSCNASSYLSKQRDRAYRVSVDYLNDKRYCSVYSLLTTGDMFGVKLCYDLLPNQLDPYDYEAFKKYEGNFYAAVTNCKTGKAEYIRIKDMKKDIVIIRASSSLPLLSRNVEIKGEKYLDGGIADSIPLAESIRSGNKKNVIILTQCQGYQKEPNKLVPLLKAKYWRYPKLVEAMKTRHIRYNQSLALIEKERAKGKAFVFQPQRNPGIKRIEKDKDKLRKLYEFGYTDAKMNYDKLMKFLEQEHS